MNEPDTERPLASEPCQRLACPFEDALCRLHAQDEKRIRSEQAIVENLDRLADSFQRMQRQHQDRELDVLELRHSVDAQAADLLVLRDSVRHVHDAQARVLHRVGSVKYWVAAIVGGLVLVSQFLEPLFKLLVRQ